MKTKKLKKQYLTPPSANTNTSQFSEYSITINGNVLSVTGDAREAQQVEILWSVINDYCIMTGLANTPAELQDWIRNTLARPNDVKALSLFARQQSELQRIINQISEESLNGELSNDVLGQLGNYSMYQLVLQVLFGIHTLVIGDGVQHIIDAQRNNPALVVEFNHLDDCQCDPLMSLATGKLH